MITLLTWTEFNDLFGMTLALTLGVGIGVLVVILILWLVGFFDND